MHFEEGCTAGITQSLPRTASISIALEILYLGSYQFGQDWVLLCIGGYKSPGRDRGL